MDIFYSPIVAILSGDPVNRGTTIVIVVLGLIGLILLFHRVFRTMEQVEAETQKNDYSSQFLAFVKSHQNNHEIRLKRAEDNRRDMIKIIIDSQKESYRKLSRNGRFTDLDDYDLNYGALTREIVKMASKEGLFYRDDFSIIENNMIKYYAALAMANFASKSDSGQKMIGLYSETLGSNKVSELPKKLLLQRISYLSAYRLFQELKSDMFFSDMRVDDKFIRLRMGRFMSNSKGIMWE